MKSLSRLQEIALNLCDPTETETINEINEIVGYLKTLAREAHEVLHIHGPCSCVEDVELVNNIEDFLIA